MTDEELKEFAKFAIACVRLDSDDERAERIIIEELRNILDQDY